VKQPRGIPNLLCHLAVESAALIDVVFGELLTREEVVRLQRAATGGGCQILQHHQHNVGARFASNRSRDGTWRSMEATPMMNRPSAAFQREPRTSRHWWRLAAQVPVVPSSRV
jgi:hypothetical protein